MSYQAPERQSISSDLAGQNYALAEPLAALLDLARQARQAATEQEFLRSVAALLLSLFQAGRVEIRLTGALPGILATAAPDGSVVSGSLPVTVNPPASEQAPEQPALLPGSADADALAAPSALAELLAPLQDESALLGSLRLVAPRASAQFTAEQHALLPIVARYVTLLLRGRREHEQVRDLAIADERSRLARDLHDGVVQSLVALVLRLDHIEEPRGEILEMRLLAHQALDEARRAIWGLRPALLETLPLHEALAREVERLADESGLSSRVTVVGQPRPLLPQQEMALFRIAQEALSNVIRHAAAHRVRVNLAYAQDQVRLVIEDNGRGFDPTALAKVEPAVIIPPWPPYFNTAESSGRPREEAHFGLRTMRERARLVGGWLEVESAPGQGTRIIVSLPYAPRAGLSFLPSVKHAEAPALIAPDEKAALPDTFPAASSPSPAALPTGNPSPSAPPIPAGRIRILIVDDHAVTRTGIRQLLERYPDFEIVGEAADALEALAEAQDLGPQVVLLDMRLPGMNGIEALRQLRASNPDLRILMLSAYEQDEDVLESLKAGASGYILKDIAPDELARAVRVVARGETLLAPGLTGKLVDRFGRLARGENQAGTLTARETEVLHALASGLRNKEIARQLQVGERTITFHLANIYQKLGASSRTEALSRALELGLLKS